MSKKIQSKFGAPLSGVLIKRQHLRRQRGSDNLLEHAKRRAKEMCLSAAQQAEDMRQQGYLSGYAEGLEGAVMAAVQGMRELAGLQQQLEQGLRAQVYATLESIFTGDELLLSIIDRVVQLECAPELKRLRVYWPTFAVHSRQVLIQRLLAAGLDVQLIEAPDSQRLVVEWGEHFWQFDTAAAQTHATDTVMLTLNHGAQLEQACRHIRRQTFETLLSELSVTDSSHPYIKEE